MNYKTLLKSLSIVAITLSLSACSKVNKENYDKLSAGMEYPEVTNLIGSPDSCETNLGIKSCIWGDDTKYIKVSFAFDKATVFSNKGIQQ